MFEWLIAAFEVIFSPLAVFKPLLSLLIVSAVLTLILTLLNRFLVDRKVMKEVKKRMEEIRENLTKAQREGNKEEVSKFLAEMNSLLAKNMKQTFKVLIISLVVISLFLPWLKYKYEGLTVATLPFSLPLIGSSLSWVFWYVLVSFAIGWVIRKLIEGE